MDRSKKIEIGEEATRIQIAIYKGKHWGNHGNDDNGWIGYVIVAGIFVSSFSFLVVFS